MNTIRKYVWLVYWLIFAVLTILAGREPGFVRNRAAVTFPWEGVVWTWLVIGFHVLILATILKGVNRNKLGRRYAAALLYSTGLLLFTVVTHVTDMPGYSYVPRQFAFATWILVVLIGLGVSILRLLRSNGVSQGRAS